MFSNLRILMICVTAPLMFWMNGAAQCKEFIIGAKGDTLNCVDMKGLKQGRWVNKFEELRGEPGYEEEGEYKDGKKTGPWRLYTLMGDLIAIENYRFGFKHGQQQIFNAMGDLLREESWLAQDPEKPTETVEVLDINDPKKVYLVEVKLEASTVPHGIWKIFEPGTGKVLQKQNFIFGKLDDGSGTANGVLKKDPNDKSEAVVDKKEEKKDKPKPKEVMDYEKKNSGKKKIKIRTGETGG
ncbi:MAG: hypothetical protein ACK5DG_09945 [Chitinophagaceae bacterium]|jgi:hypothetical protein